ncbi:hypothetical protein G6F65_021381 [Rhizopus arrhizus]|nr:hypothetical protein G6F65_021381 [Rhizopus arrhizus]
MPSATRWKRFSGASRRTSLRGRHAAGGHRPGGHRRRAVPADLARIHHPAAGGAGFHRGHVRAAAGVRLFHQRPVAVRDGACHRYRGG